MKLARIAATLAAVLICSSTLVGAEKLASEPFGFKGYQIGKLARQIPRLAEMTCLERVNGFSLACAAGIGFETIAERPVQSISLVFLDDRLSAVSVRIRRRDHEEVMAALARRYGEPAIVDDVGDDGDMGPGRLVIFLLREGQITVRSNVNALQETVVAFSNDGTDAQFDAAKERHQRAAERDL